MASQWGWQTRGWNNSACTLFVCIIRHFPDAQPVKQLPLHVRARVSLHARGDNKAHRPTWHSLCEEKRFAFKPHGAPGRFLIRQAAACFAWPRKFCGSLGVVRVSVPGACSGCDRVG